MTLDQNRGKCVKKFPNKSKLTDLNKKYLVRFNIIFIFEDIQLVLLEWLLQGERSKEVVHLSEARSRRLELEAIGAVIYWSERV